MITHINFGFRSYFPEKNILQLRKHSFLELISRKLHYMYLFVIQRITWKECLEIIFLTSLISVTQKSVSELIS